MQFFSVLEPDQVAWCVSFQLYSENHPAEIKRLIYVLYSQYKIRQRIASEALLDDSDTCSQSVLILLK